MKIVWEGGYLSTEELCMPGGGTSPSSMRVPRIRQDAPPEVLHLPPRVQESWNKYKSCMQSTEFIENTSYVRA